MADETATTWANFLREQRGPLVEVLRWATVLFTRVQRDMDETRWDGSQVRIPLILTPQQGTAGITETSTLGVTRTVESTKALVDSAIITIPISFSTKVMNQSRTGGGNSWAEVIPTKMRLARDAYERTINEMMMGGGDALLAAVAGATGASGGPTQNINVGTTANFYELYLGRVVDVKHRTTGAVVATGVKITGVNEATGIITVTNYDGSSTSFATATTDGVFIESTTRAPAGSIVSDAMAGLGQITATSGTFEGVSRTSFPQWQGTDVSPGSATDLVMSILDRAERVARRKSGTAPTFYIGDPAVIDKYQQGLSVQAEWAGDSDTLESGFSGVKYRGKVLMHEYDAPAGVLYGVYTPDLKIYTLDDGPDWDEKDGSMFKRFARALPLEAWLVWMLQFGAHRCNSQVRIGNLTQAT